MIQKPDIHTPFSVVSNIKILMGPIRVAGIRRCLRVRPPKVRGSGLQARMAVEHRRGDIHTEALFDTFS